MSKLKELCDLYFNLFSNKNLEKLTELFSDEIVLKDWNVQVIGKYAVRQEYKNIFNDNPYPIKVQTLKYYEEENTVCCEIILIINNGEFNEEVIDVITFNENDLIKKIKAYKI